MYRAPQKKCTQGFTLVETIIVIALTTLISGALLSGIASFYRFNGYVVAQAYQVSHVRVALEQMIRDLREMTYADDGTFPLVTMEDTAIGFFSDIDRDNSVEYVEYSLSTTTLERKIYNATGSPPVYSTSSPETTVTLSEYVQNSLQATPVFVYFDENGNPATPTTTITDIRYVEVSVIVNIDPVRDPGEFMLRSSASLRNLKTYE